MNVFSVAAVTSDCSNISHRALSSSIELDEISQRLERSDPILQKLNALSITLQAFKQNVDDLRVCLEKSSIISGEVQAVLTRSLKSCDEATAIMDKQLKRLGPENLSALNTGVVAVYDEFLVANSQLFVFFMQLLSIMERRAQDGRLAAADGQRIIQRAETGSRHASNARDILLDGTSTGGASDPSSLPAIGSPPAYQPSQPSSSKQPASGFSLGLSSLTGSFKAIASGFRAKPEPFVVPLCEAAMRGEILQIKGFLGQGVNINGRNEEGYTPLICAILSQRQDAVQLLLDSGADITVKDSAKKLPPLFHAAAIGSLGIAGLLVSKGANINEKSWSGQPFFVDVVGSDNIDGIRFFLELGVSANTRSISGRQVLAQAVKKGSIEVVRLLLQYGADANAYDITGASLLSTAIAQDNEDLAELLLSSGADPNSRTLTGLAILADVIQRNKINLAKALLARGADPNARDLYGQTILLAVVKDAKLDVGEKTEIARMLLAHGATATTVDSWGIPIICHVMGDGNLNLLKVLLEHGAQANSSMSTGETLLLYTIDHGWAEQAELLLKYGAIPNTADKKGRTPLMEALKTPTPRLIRSLMQHGANLNQPGQMSPADFAKALGNREILDSLGMSVPSSSATTVAAPVRATASRAEAQPRSESPPPGYESVTTKG